MGRRRGSPSEGWWPGGCKAAASDVDAVARSCADGVVRAAAAAAAGPTVET